MNKAVVAALAVAGVTGFGIASSSALAQETEGKNPMSSLVQKITQKFNLNQDEVQAVFDEDRQEHQAAMQAQFMSKLDQAVAEGKLTSTQRDLIMAKREELQANREASKDSLKDLTEAERRTKMKAERAVLQTWAEENGIDLTYLMMGHPGGRHGRPGSPGMEGIHPPEEQPEQ